MSLSDLCIIRTFPVSEWHLSSIIHFPANPPCLLSVYTRVNELPHIPIETLNTPFRVFHFIYRGNIKVNTASLFRQTRCV